MVNQFATVGGGNAALDAGEELRALFQNSGDGLLYALRSIFAFARGKLSKLRFLLGGEIPARARLKAQAFQVGNVTIHVLDCHVVKNATRLEKAIDLQSATSK